LPLATVKEEIDSAIVELRPIAEGTSPNSQLNTGTGS